MKAFLCQCGHAVYFDNLSCVACHSKLGFDPRIAEMLALIPQEEGNYVGVFAQAAQGLYRDCRNRLEFEACNWLVESSDPHDYCISCRLNRTIPNLSNPRNQVRWSALERAKRRLVYTLLALKLPVVSLHEDPRNGLVFDFLEDFRDDREVDEGFVLTGHTSGVITINVLEADDVSRESMRTQMNEVYRTLLGHFRHESGHYYWMRLFHEQNERLAQFRALFGDESSDYQCALNDYYKSGPMHDWQQTYISSYAAAHPSEDWAETWAHYLHMVDTLETAVSQDVIVASEVGFAAMFSQWMDLTLKLNRLNRSMGLPDAYPFVIPHQARKKLEFVHELLHTEHEESPPNPT